ncbi:hypothetical protein AJ80_05596 [Polytolypa hystricis UAMH7299]|uniref:Solute carrier family 40 member n=1 Tax=Polytolypa hystricis (strain UAMH7299) TaxID=1447883 RepID=A0A2B7Y2H7_POLH7|nr:hypothetical protein AJ80_05596 [Polytolypa hystricis UAMH7299]
MDTTDGEGVRSEVLCSPDCVDGSVPPSIARRLYVSHFLSTWNSRVFEFGAVLYLASIFPGTLIPMSVYALARAASAILFSPALGRYVDRGNRLIVVRHSIVFQRLAVAVSCIGFLVLEAVQSLKSWSKSCLLVVLAILACVEKLCSIVNLTAVERDWVVVIAQDDEKSLQALNSQMRRVDLVCKLVGPFAIALLDGVSTQIAILVNLAMNASSILLEYYAIAKVYKSVPALQESKQLSEPLSPRQAARNDDDNQQGFWFWQFPLKSLQEIKFYYQHPAFLPSFACSLLYFTVLSFSGQMINYLLSLGYTSFHIGISRTVSVIFEISATWIAPKVMAKIGPIRAGIWFLSWQMLSLVVAASFFWELDSGILAATGLVCGTIFSRIGLWGFDLSAQIIVQAEVELERRGSFSSTEAAWQNAFELCSYVATIIFSRPEQFQWPVLMSCIAVFISGGLYAAFVRSRRGHLLHLPSCLEIKGAREVVYERLP